MIYWILGTVFIVLLVMKKHDKDTLKEEIRILTYDNAVLSRDLERLKTISFAKKYAKLTKSKLVHTAYHYEFELPKSDFTLTCEFNDIEGLVSRLQEESNK